jgi:hypothetical protein
VESNLEVIVRVLGCNIEKATQERSRLASEYNQDIRNKIDQLEAGLSFAKIAEKLNALGFKTRRGNEWKPEGVRRVMQ